MLSLPAMETLPWTVSCTDPGTHQFIFCGSADPGQHVNDSVPGNNGFSIPFSVEVGGAAPILPPARTCVPPALSSEVCDNSTDDDGDTLIDEEPDTDFDGLSDCADSDDDNDGFSDTVETYVGTDPLNACPVSVNDAAWPSDFNNSRAIDILDVLQLKPVFNAVVPPGLPRHDIQPDSSVNILDVLAMKPTFGDSC
jgi:hypothetical protein